MSDFARAMHVLALRAAYLVPLLFWLVGCGGSGGAGPSSSGPITPPSVLRTDLLVGYYGDCDSCALETGDHTNLYWVWGWGTSPFWLTNAMAHLQQARGAGITRVVLGLPQAYGPNAEGEVRFALTRLNDAGLLADVVALYPIDEPDLYGKSDDEVRATNVMLRRVAGEFPALAGVRLAVIYAGANDFPGVSSYDWVGFDDYGAGCAVLGAPYGALKAALRPDQRIMLVPGGADPWRQDPACFAARAHADPQVVAVVPFIWFDNAAAGVGPGIRSNPTRPLYCQMGRVITGRGGVC